nr:hypothetical protein [Pedobacter ureilyticus]
MKTLNLKEMEVVEGGDAGVTCVLDGRTEFGGIRISSWSCSNGQTMTNFSVMNEEGMWDVMFSI